MSSEPLDPQINQSQSTEKRVIEDTAGKGILALFDKIALGMVVTFTIPVILYSFLTFSNLDHSMTTQCYVLSDQDGCLTNEDSGEDGINMTARFYLLAIIGLVLATFTWFNMIWTQYCLPKAKLMGGAVSIMVDMPITFVWIIILSIMRFSHAGQVVSGSLCTDETTCTEDQGYMLLTGLIIKIWVIWVYILVALVVLLSLSMKNQRGGATSPKISKEYLAKYEHVGDKPIGAGDCGCAWRVKLRNSEDDTIYVAKEFYGADSICQISFQPEANALRVIDHPGIVKLIEIYGEGNAGSVIVLEFCKGDNLQNSMDKNYIGKPIPIDIALDYMLQMSKALQYLHCTHSMAHKDLHSGNWMVKDNGQMKLIDFGLAFVIPENTQVKYLYQAELMMAPEQIDNELAGLPADVWYLAIILYTLIHPKKHIPFIDDWNSPNYYTKWIYNSVKYTYLVKKRTPFLRLEGRRGELFNHLFERLFDFNQETRADMTEVVQILETIKENFDKGKKEDE